jgi:hemerythrin
MNRLALADELRTLEAEQQNLRKIASSLETLCRESVEKARCDGCDKPMATSCAGVLNDSLAVLLIFLMTLARHEERLMRHVCTSQEFLTRFGAHVEDHANLCAELAGIAAISAALPPAAIYAKVMSLTQQWFNEHFATHDLALVDYLMRSQESAVGAASTNNVRWVSFESSAAEVGVYANKIASMARQSSIRTPI